MKWLLLSLFSSSLIFLCWADDAYNCQSAQTISPPANLSLVWNYPNTWNISLEPPQYAGGQNCSWTFNIPKGMFVYFSMKADTKNQAKLTMTDSIGYVTSFTKTDIQPFFLMDPSFRVDLEANGVGNLGLRVVWYQVNTTAYNPERLRVSSNSSPVFRTNGEFDNGLVIESETRVSLLSMAPEKTITGLVAYMRVTQVYDGPDMNSTFRGNLLQIMDSGHNFVSTGKYLTLYSLFPGFAVGNPVILQDYNDVKNFKTYKGVTCLVPTICQISLDASQGTVAALRYSPAGFFVKQISMPQTNKLSVYNDYVTSVHRLADYTSTLAKTNIPQKFFGKFTTFVLDKDQATIQLTDFPNDAKWTTGFNGRRGFIASPNYGVNSLTNQYVAQQVGGNGLFNITFNVDRSAIIKGSALTVRVFNGDGTSVDETYSPTNFPAGPVWAKGNSISVSYDSNSTTSSGAFVSFGFDEYNSASGSEFLGAIIISLWVTLIA